MVQEHRLYIFEIKNLEFLNNFVDKKYENVYYLFCQI